MICLCGAVKSSRPRGALCMIKGLDNLNPVWMSCYAAWHVYGLGGIMDWLWVYNHGVALSRSSMLCCMAREGVLQDLWGRDEVVQGLSWLLCGHEGVLRGCLGCCVAVMRWFWTAYFVQGSLAEIICSRGHEAYFVACVYMPRVGGDAAWLCLSWAVSCVQKLGQLA
ncbi:hypothetical protein E3N88_16153 [Mikania micrantha]|uniref:Uncharacterized protein n=1 Tax=Mikania micrantha TaxID=192012 RepID=A0A5N6NZR4_9ASTR|nr:hypothetical protein E3N88_16153 [Mikania micrantha]